MYFVHPQIKLNKISKALFSLIKPAKPEILVKKLSAYFPEKQIIFTDMGRTAFRIIIEKFNLQNSEIIFPAYLCDIFYPLIKQYSIKPIFLDMDLETFHLKADEIKEKITPNTKAILICHTYGLPLDITKLKNVIFNLPKRLLIIEDCAHSLGAKFNQVWIGNFGDVSFFSLYKQFPAFRGGMLVCPKDWQLSLARTFFSFRDWLSFLNCFPVFAYFFKKIGGKVAPKIIRKEKLSGLARINRVSLNLFAGFFEDFEKNLEKRKELALFFQKELNSLGFEVQESENNVFCHFSALVPKNLEEKRDEIVKKLRGKGVFCTRIWHTPIILNEEFKREYRINLTEFPNTIEAAKRIINFPLQDYYTKEDMERMIAVLREIIKT